MSDSREAMEDDYQEYRQLCSQLGIPPTKEVSFYSHWGQLKKQVAWDEEEEKEGPEPQMKTDLSPSPWVSTIVFEQDPDSCGPRDEIQRLEITAEDPGTGEKYMVLKTDRWAVDNIQEMVDILLAFQKMNQTK